MANRSGQKSRLSAIDEITPASAPVTLETRTYDTRAEDRWLQFQFRRERASAYWFAAAKWGLLGLVFGVCLGAFMMYTATVSTLPTAIDAVARGAAIDAARDAAEGTVTRPQPTP
jgi:hypothetical protein